MNSLEDVRKSTLEYYEGDELRTNIWIDKYCLNNKGELMELSPLDMYKRLATEFHRIEQNYPNPLSYDEIYYLLSEEIILPGGSLLYGIGNNYALSSLGNCFCIGVPADSYGGICHTDQEQIQLMKRRAGVGHDLSHLRPSGSSVTNAAKSSTGMVSFMERYSNSTREVAQDGRRGALMLTADITHPDAGKFIEAKDNLTKITGANISVKVDDAFMNSLNIDKEITKEMPNGNIITMKTIEGYDYVNLNKELWSKLIHQSWKTAEPGVLFWDTILRESPADCYGSNWKSVSTNPCKNYYKLVA